MNEERLKLQNFLKRLNSEPNQSEIKINQHAGNSRYLPISFIEMTLDEYFFGQWSTENFRWQVMANEVVGSIDLIVEHPVSGKTIKRTGCSAVMIRQKRGAGVTQIEEKIHNALEMDFPHLKADCIRNAAQSLGKLFGRDLNRKFADNYRPIITSEAVNNGAITAQVQQDTGLSEALHKVGYLMEQARMDDQTEQSITLSLSKCETASEVFKIMEIVKDYLPPSNDPAKQFKEFNL